MQEETAKKGRIAWRWIVGPVALFAVLVALILTTGKPAAAELMRDAAGSFSKVERGDFRFAIAITPHGDPSASPSSIELSGPFEVVPGKPLPKARIAYTVSSGGRSQVVTLLTTGDRGYTLVRGQAYELPAATTKQLKAATKDLNKPGSKGLSGINLHFNKWLVDPTVSAGPEIDGVPTWRTDAGVDIVDALKDFMGSAGTLGSITGQKLPGISDKDAAEIRRGIKNAKVSVYVGRYDGIMRRMDLTMDFNTPAGQSAGSGAISGGRMNMVIGIADPNQPVAVSPPKNPLPYSALQSLVESQASQTGTALDDGLGQ